MSDCSCAMMAEAELSIANGGLVTFHHSMVNSGRKRRKRADKKARTKRRGRKRRLPRAGHLLDVEPELPQRAAELLLVDEPVVVRVDEREGLVRRLIYGRKWLLGNHSPSKNGAVLPLKTAPSERTHLDLAGLRLAKGGVHLRGSGRVG